MKDIKPLDPLASLTPNEKYSKMSHREKWESIRKDTLIFLSLHKQILEQILIAKEAKREVELEMEFNKMLRDSRKNFK